MKRSRSPRIKALRHAQKALRVAIKKNRGRVNGQLVKKAGSALKEIYLNSQIVTNLPALETEYRGESND